MKKITLLLVMFLVGIFANAQFVENFDADSVQPPNGNVWNLPSGQWQVFNEGGVGTVMWGLNTAQFPAFSAPRAAMVNRENLNVVGATSRNFLVTPVIQNSGLMELRFWTRTTLAPLNNTEFKVFAAPATADPADPASFTIPVANWSEDGPNRLNEQFDVYEEKVVTLNTAGLGPQFYLAFVKEYTQLTGAINGDRWLIDDVRVLAPCLAPTNLTSTPLATSATLSWNGPATATYYVHVLPQGAVFDGVTAGAYVVNGALSTTITSTTAPTVAPLQPDTAYDFYVFADCGLSTSTWSEKGEFRTSIAPPACGGIFTDTGGQNGDYSSSEDYTVTICPENPGDMVIVSFTAFETEANWDGLFIYNGTSTSAPQISSGNGNGNVGAPGAFWGTQSPGTVEAENPSGCLTFRFKSDSSGVRSGWVANVTCVTPPDCSRPTLVTAPIVLHNSATVNWEATPGVTQYEVLILPCGTTPSANATGTQVTGTSHTFTGLNGSTCYTVYVRAICSAEESSLWTTGLTINTPMTPPACGGMFYDNGGPNGNYENSSDYTVTICPENEGDIVTIIFTSFETEANWDGLFIYNGASTSAPQISSGNGNGNLGAPGAFWGTQSPGTVMAENPTGCLTFRFKSDGSGNRTGWTANVVCTEAPACQRATAITTSQVLSTSMNVSWTAAPGVTEYVVVAAACGAAVPTPTSAGAVTVTGTSTQLTGLTADTCYTIYVFAICPDGSYSAPNNSANVNTQLAPPECGGMFTDNGGQNGNYLNSSNYTVTICPENEGDLVTINFLTFETEANWDGLLIYDGNSVNAPQISSGAGTGNGQFNNITGAFWGTNSPGLVEATNPTGCLTFRFISDGSGNRMGWTAQITCGPPPTCMRPTGVAFTTLLHNLAELTWNEVEGAGEYVVFAVPCGQPAPAPTADGGVVTTTNSATVTGLEGSTCYTFYVYAKCEGDDWSPNSLPLNGTTSVTPPACGGVFTDNGGASGNYLASSDYTVTICPENPGDMVTVTFTSFNTETNYDGLLIYDGPSINSPQISSGGPSGNGGLAGIPGAFWGTNSPGTVVSTDNSGCLTFRFISDGIVQYAGWTANVTCSPQPNCYKPTNFQITDVTPYSFTVNWEQPQAMEGEEIPTSWEVIMVPAGSSIEGITGFVVDQLPYTVGGLMETTCYDFYVRAICPGEEGGYSMWLIKTNVCTKPTNDNCEDARDIPVNPNLFCGQTTTGGLTGATPSNFTSTCASVGTNADDDVWYSFTATAESHAINVQNTTGGSGLGFEVLSGSCGSFTSIYCENNTTTTAGTITSQFIRNAFVPGQTYFVRVYSVGTNPVSTGFTICVGQIPCIEAEPFCGEQPITYQNATNVPDLGTVGCLYTTPNPAFFFLEVKESGPLNYLMTQSNTPNGAPTLDVDYVTWGPFANNEAACEFVSNLSTTNMIAQGTCPSLHGCSYSAAPTETVCIPNAIQCEVYVIMITNYANQPGYITFTQSNLQSPTAGETNCYAVNTFNYEKHTYCQSEDDPAPILAYGAVHGEYTSTPGLVIDPVTGIIDLSESIPGVYMVTSTLNLIDTTCQNNATVIRRREIEIVAKFQAEFSYDQVEFCQNDPKAFVNLITDAPNGVFSATPQGLSIHPIDGTIFPAGSQPGQYTVSFTVPGNCVVHVEDVIIDILPAAELPELEDVTACGSYTIPTYGDIEGAHFYDNPEGNGEILDGTELTSGTTTIYLIAGEGNCRSIEEMTITVIDGTPLEQDDIEACDSYQLGTPDQGHYYSAPNGEGDVLDGQTLTETTTIYWYIESGECSLEEIFTVTVSATPVVEDYPDVTQCDSYTLPALASGAYFDANNNLLPVGTTITSTQTVYVREVAADNPDCFAEDSILITIQGVPQVVVQNGCIENDYTIIATVTNAVPGVTYNYVWYNPNGNVVGTNSDELVLAGDAALGQYSVVVTAAGSECEGVGSANVLSTQCMIQKGISADGDGINDYFDLAGYAVSKLRIYNRYGMVVYDKGNYSTEFVGKDNKGNELPVGTYYYVIELSNGAPSITGWIYIAR